MSLWSKIFGPRNRRPSSSDVAKDRLRVVLIHDRSDVSPELLETLRQEILDVISRHVIIDEAEGIDVTLSETRGHSRLQATIPLLGRRRQSGITSRRSARDR